MNVEETKQWLAKNGVNAEFIDHGAKDGLKSEDAAHATGTDIARVLKVLCFVNSKGNRCFAMLQGNKKVDLNKIPGFGKARLATEQELGNWFGAQPGAVPPVALPPAIPKFIDSGVMEMPFVIGSAGSRFVGLKIQPSDIIKQENAKVLEISR